MCKKADSFPEVLKEVCTDAFSERLFDNDRVLISSRN